MILRLIAVALLYLPQTVVLPRQHMVRIGFQRALVPDLREFVVAEFTIGIADQIGHVRVIVLAERLQLLDGVSIIVAIVDRRIGRTVTLSDAGIVEAGLFVGLLFALVGGAGGPGIRRRRCRGSISRTIRVTTTTTATTSSASGGKSRDDGGRGNQRRQKHGQCHKPDRRGDHACLLLSKESGSSSRRCKPQSA